MTIDGTWTFRNSSLVKKIDWIRDKEQLLIEFHNGGSASYYEVSEEEFQAFVLSENFGDGSAGRYYNNNIKRIKPTSPPPEFNIGDEIDYAGFSWTIESIYSDEVELVRRLVVNKDSLKGN